MSHPHLTSPKTIQEAHDYVIQNHKHDGCHSNIPTQFQNRIHTVPFHNSWNSMHVTAFTQGNRLDFVKRNLTMAQRPIDIMFMGQPFTTMEFGQFRQRASKYFEEVKANSTYQRLSQRLQKSARLQKSGFEKSNSGSQLDTQSDLDMDTMLEFLDREGFSEEVANWNNDKLYHHRYLAVDALKRLKEKSKNKFFGSIFS